MVQGKWNVTIKTPAGMRTGVLDLLVDGKKLSGSLSDAEHYAAIEEGRIDGNTLSWSAKINRPMRLNLKFTAVVDGDQITGNARHILGSAAFSGVRIHPTGT